MSGNAWRAHHVRCLPPYRCGRVCVGYGIYASRLGPSSAIQIRGRYGRCCHASTEHSIPHRQGPENPVANDTNSVVPSAPAKQEVEKREPIPDKNAVAIPDRTPKKVAEQPRHKQTYVEPAQPNQVNSRIAPATVNPMYSMNQGGTGVGIGPNSLLGQQYGWYAEMVRKIIARNWVTSGLAGHQASPAIVGFVISRTGSVSDVKLVQPSGNPAIDNSALRAVYNSNPLPALPAGSLPVRHLQNSRSIYADENILLYSPRPCGQLRSRRSATECADKGRDQRKRPEACYRHSRFSRHRRSSVFHGCIQRDGPKGYRGFGRADLCTEILFSLQVPQQPSDLVAGAADSGPGQLQSQPARAMQGFQPCRLGEPANLRELSRNWVCG